jgi:hypothetical protein
VKNDEEVYLQLRNIQQQIVECVEVYYEQLFKFTNCLWFKAMDVFFTSIFQTGFLPYLHLETTSMKRDIFKSIKKL